MIPGHFDIRLPKCKVNSQNFRHFGYFWPLKLKICRNTLKINERLTFFFLYLSPIIFSKMVYSSKQTFNSITKGGGQIEPHFFWASLTAKQLIEWVWNFLTFPINLLTKHLAKKNFFFKGFTPIWPLKGGANKKLPQLAAYDPRFLGSMLPQNMACSFRSFRQKKNLGHF